MLIFKYFIAFSKSTSILLTVVAAVGFQKTLQILNSKNGTKFPSTICGLRPWWGSPCWVCCPSRTRHSLAYFQILRLAELQATPVVNPQYQTYCNFKLPVYAGKEDNNFQMWIETAVNKILSITSCLNTGSEKQVTSWKDLLLLGITPGWMALASTLGRNLLMGCTVVLDAPTWPWA